MGCIDKRQMILDATVKVLSCRGFHGFSMKQLADEAGVAAGTIYIYFKDKEALIEQLHLEIIRKVAEAFFHKHDPSAPAAEQFALFCNNYWNFCMQDREILFSKAQFDHLPPDILVNQRKDAREIFAPLMNLFEQCRSKGELKNFSDEVLISLSIEPLYDLACKVHQGILTREEVPLDPVIAACWDAMARKP